jgi:hypothetical protein
MDTEDAEQLVAVIFTPTSSAKILMSPMIYFCTSTI